MADAGKIVITPKGAYSSTATYEWLDEVTYDGKAYIALKTVTGVTPSDDGVNWRLFLAPNDIVAGNLVPTFTEASTRSNIISGENLSTILGKVKKYFTDLKGHAFNDTVNNLTTSTTGSALDASQGKVLKDGVDEINSNLEQLEFGENSGNNNLWCLKNSYSISGSGEIINDLFSLHKGVYILSFDTSATNGASEWSFKDSNGNRVHSQIIFNYDGTRRSILFQTSGDATKVEVYQNIAGTISNIQIVKGETNIPYEPHIPSVKMLAEDVDSVKNDLTVKNITPTASDGITVNEYNEITIFNGYAFMNLNLEVSETKNAWSTLLENLPKVSKVYYFDIHKMADTSNTTYDAYLSDARLYCGSKPLNAGNYYGQIVYKIS